MRTRLLVVSLDAMVREDVEYLKTLPNFKKYFGGYSEVTTIRSIYPTVTYPVHVSITTGCYPEKHGVTNNTPFHTFTGEAPWCWYHDIVKVPDIFTAAKKAGYRTASVFWPVTGCHPDIDNLIDEYWPEPGETLDHAFHKTGSNDRMIALLKKHIGLLAPTAILGGRKNVVTQPGVDNFLFQCASDIIEQDLADVLFIHGGYIDHTRHTYGVFNDEVTKGIRLCDGWIGQLMEALERSGHLDDTNVVLLSDHGQQNIVRAVNVNAFFKEKGWIETDGEGKVLSWKVYSLSAACSSVVYVKDPADEPMVEKTLREMADEGIYGFTKVMNRSEMRQEHLSGDFAFALEGDGYSSLVSGTERPIVRNLDNEDYRYGHATHGYLPDKGPQPFFLVKGPAFKSGVTLKRRHIVDEAPTFARILGVSLPEAQGKCMDALLRKEVVG
jgi:predicted AlkP superfamily pyrophosphatase or phosphodiesterase